MKTLIPSLMVGVSIVGCRSDNGTQNKEMSIPYLAKKVAEYASKNGESFLEQEVNPLTGPIKNIGTSYQWRAKSDSDGTIVVNYIDIGSDGVGEGDSLRLGHVPNGDFRFYDINLDGFYVSDERRQMSVKGTESAFILRDDEPLVYKGLGSSSDEMVPKINEEYRKTLESLIKHIPR